MNQTTWVEIAAILLGPLVGIWVTRIIDRAKEASARRYALFETLMRTRGLELTPEHVGAINMVPVIFQAPKFPEVMDAWVRLMDTYSDRAWEAENEKDREAVVSKAAKCRMTLLNSVASAVGERLPSKEEHRPGYAPKHWATQFTTQVETLQLLKEVLGGERALKMLTGVVDYTQASSESDSAALEAQGEQLEVKPSRRAKDKGPHGAD